MELKEPRASFAGTFEIPNGTSSSVSISSATAMWNYLATPFIFVRDGFDIQELAPHEEDCQSCEFCAALSERHPDALRYGNNSTSTATEY